MKIISKHKDYYDYLQGVNGIDSLLVLDRTKSSHHSSFSNQENDIVHLIVCGLLFEGVFKSGKFRYGKDIEPFLKEKDSISTHNYHIYDKNKFSNVVISKEPTIYDMELEHPIYTFKRYHHSYVDKDKLEPFPILKDYNFQSVYSPEDIWNHISNWLSKPKNIPNNQSNKEKIVSAGFDLKTSFRKM